MTPKTERFEMRLDEDVLTRVDNWRAAQSDVPSRAEAMRRLVDLGLAHSSEKTTRFSDGEKLLIVMLRDLYKHLKVSHGEIDPDFISDVISGGHYWAPRWELSGLFHDHEDAPDEVRFALDVMELWDVLERSFEKLSQEDRERVEKEAGPFGKHVEFLGFDGNNESTYVGIARFLVDKMDRFSRFKGRDLNSHMPTLATYRRMLSAFAPMRSNLLGGELDPAKIILILKAKQHPKHLGQNT